MLFFKPKDRNNIKLDPIIAQYIGETTCLFMDKKATIIDIDALDFEDDIPSLTIAYMDNIGVVHTKHMYPREVSILCTPIEKK